MNAHFNCFLEIGKVLEIHVKMVLREMDCQVLNKMKVAQHRVHWLLVVLVLLQLWVTPTTELFY